MSAVTMNAGALASAEPHKRRGAGGKDGDFNPLPVLGAIVAVGAVAVAAVKVPSAVRRLREPSAADGLDLLQRRALAESSPLYPDVVLGGNGLEAAADAKLAPHFIRRADVADFLADSKVRNTVHHGATNERTYYGILLDGARISKNKRTVHGKGFYTALQPGGWGERSFEVAVKVQNPTFDTNPLADAKIVKRIWGADWVVARRSENVKLVVDLPGQAPGRPANAPAGWDDPPADWPPGPAAR